MATSIEDILRGRHVGRMQSVGHMQVIPILGEDDNTWSEPDVSVGNTNYGHVNVRNESGHRTIVPPGAAFVSPDKSQDHAVGDGSIVPGKGAVDFNTARCIQDSQGGLLRRQKGIMTILPASLRTQAIKLEATGSSYSSLWGPIRTHNEKYGLRKGGHLNYFLDEFGKQLDEFVAEFELLDGQIGAIVLVDGKIAGVEVTPNQTYWKYVWTPLIRVCYGSLALLARKKLGERPPATRSPLEVLGAGLDDIRAALRKAEKAAHEVVESVVVTLAGKSLESPKQGRSVTVGNAQMTHVYGGRMLGQIVTERGRVPYASLTAGV